MEEEKGQEIVNNEPALKCCFMLERGKKKRTPCGRIPATKELEGRHYCLTHYRLLVTRQENSKAASIATTAPNMAVTQLPLIHKQDDEELEKGNVKGNKRKTRSYSDSDTDTDEDYPEWIDDNNGIDFNKLQRLCMESLHGSVGWK